MGRGKGKNFTGHRDAEDARNRKRAKPLGNGDLKEEIMRKEGA